MYIALTYSRCFVEAEQQQYTRNESSRLVSELIRMFVPGMMADESAAEAEQANWMTHLIEMFSYDYSSWTKERMT